MGYGLFNARRWAYRLVFIITGLYTLDRLVYILDRKALQINLTTFLDKYGVAIDAAQMALVLNVILIATVLIMLCWWGFAWYAYFRRAYFYPPIPDSDPESRQTDE